MRRMWWLRAVKVTLFAAIAAGVIGLVVMLLWNWLAPDLFGGRTIDFVQALGLFVLARLLVGGWRGRAGHGHWRHRMAERWSQLSDEERARIRESMGRGCGRGRQRGREADDRAAPAAPLDRPA